MEIQEAEKKATKEGKTLPPEKKELELDKDLRSREEKGVRDETLEKRMAWWQSQGLPHLEQDYRSEEHTSELQSRFDLVCRLLLEKKKKKTAQEKKRRKAYLRDLHSVRL